jgi:hypothetical protein
VGLALDQGAGIVVAGQLETPALIINNARLRGELLI